MKRNKSKEKPYLIKKVIIRQTQRIYNPNYGKDRICLCGHTYHRHFDSYEGMKPIGCKYCYCSDFKEAPPMPIDKDSTLPMEEQLNNYHQKLEEDWKKEQERLYQEHYNNSI